MNKNLVLRGSYAVEFFNFEKGFYMPFLRFSCNRDFLLGDLISFTECRVRAVSSRSKKPFGRCVLWFRVRLSDSWLHHFRVELKSCGSRGAAL